MLKNKFKILAITSSLLVVNTASATSVPPSAPQMAFSPPMYGSFCQNWIDAMDFKPAAMAPINDVETTLSNAIYMPLLNTIQTMSLKAGQTITDSFNKLSQEEMTRKMNETKRKIEIEKNMEEYELEHQQYLDIELEKQNSKLFSDGNGALSKEYFRNMCTKAKIVKNTQGPRARYKNAAKVSAAVQNAVREQANTVSTTASMRQLQEDRANKYCSMDEKRDGVCKEVSAFPNGDIDSFLFLNPVGFKKADSSQDFETRYTYNKAEVIIANDYIKNVVGILPVEPPQIHERNDAKKQQFIEMYNSTVNALNMARFSYINALEKRKPLGKGNTPEDQRSALDYQRYLIQKMDDSKQLSVIEASGGAGKDVALYNAVAMSNKLQLELYLQNERIKLLEAAILAQEENSSLNQRYMKSRK